MDGQQRAAAVGLASRSTSLGKRKSHIQDVPGGVCQTSGGCYVKVYRYNPKRQGRSPAEIVGSNPTGGMDICLL